MGGARVHAQPVADKARGRGGVLECINRVVNGTLERIFEALGRFIGRRPVLVIVGATHCRRCGACCAY